jgi:uncharacterized membrane protein YphA (DoxX/SURF4 family)
MRRILSAAARGAGGWFRGAAGAWNSFWFKPADPTLLGLIRILAGLMLVYTHFVWGLGLESFFGADGWFSSPAAVEFLRSEPYVASDAAGEEAAVQTRRNPYILSFWWWVPYDWIWYAHGASLVVLVLFTIGFWTRLTAVLSFVVVVSYVYRIQPALFGLDQINGMLMFYLMIGPSGDALSVDRWLARRRARRRGDPAAGLARPSFGANLALRLIQVHMCVIYFFAGVSKLKGTSWWSGEALWFTFGNLEYQTLDMTWVAHDPWFPWLINVMTHTVVAWELTFCALIWRPLLRPIVLALAVVTHVGIGACLGLWTFGLVMLIGCASFLSPTWIASVFGTRREKQGRTEKREKAED